MNRTAPSGPFSKPQIFTIQGTVSVTIATSDDWHNVTASPNTWLRNVNSADAPFSINDSTGAITYNGLDISLVQFDYSYSMFPLAGTDILIEGTLDINAALVGGQVSDPFSQFTSLLGLTANGFPFNLCGYKIVNLNPGDVIRPIFANLVDTEDFTFEKAQIVARIVG